MTGRLSAIAKQAIIMLAVICTGTVFDWLVHRTSPRFDVPSDYFLNKIIFGMLIGFIAFQVFRLFVKSAGWLAFATALTIATLLQVHYYLEGYDPVFVVLFLGIHFVGFFVPALVLFRRYRHLT